MPSVAVVAAGYRFARGTHGTLSALLSSAYVPLIVRDEADGSSTEAAQKPMPKQRQAEAENRRVCRRRIQASTRRVQPPACCTLQRCWRTPRRLVGCPGGRHSEPHRELHSELHIAHRHTHGDGAHGHTGTRTRSRTHGMHMHMHMHTPAAASPGAPRTTPGLDKSSTPTPASAMISTDAPSTTHPHAHSGLSPAPSPTAELPALTPSAPTRARAAQHEKTPSAPSSCTPGQVASRLFLSLPVTPRAWATSSSGPLLLVAPLTAALSSSWRLAACGWWPCRRSRPQRHQSTRHFPMYTTLTLLDSLLWILLGPAEPHATLPLRCPNQFMYVPQSQSVQYMSWSSALEVSSSCAP